MMIKFDIKNRFTGEVQFTAEIDCGEYELASVKMGLAVKRAINSGADLRYVNLSYANLRGANLGYADLRGADLSGADLHGVTGMNNWIKCIQIEDWPITYTSDVMQIGCQRHLLTEWAVFSDAQIRSMDGTRALNFWRKWREMIFKIIEMAPAQPTKVDAQVERGSTE